MISTKNPNAAENAGSLILGCTPVRPLSRFIRVGALAWALVGGLAATTVVAQDGNRSGNHLQNGKPSAQSTNDQLVSNSEATVRRELMEAYGGETVFTAVEIETMSRNPETAKALMDLVTAAQMVGAAEESVASAKTKYLHHPTPESLNNALFDVVADTQGVPKDSARQAGVTTAADIISLAADLQTLGDENSGDRISDPKTFETIQQKGRDGFLADVVVESRKLPPEAKDIPLTQLLDGIAKAQEKGVDTGRAGYWKELKEHPENAGASGGSDSGGSNGATGTHAKAPFDHPGSVSSAGPIVAGSGNPKSNQTKIPARSTERHGSKSGAKRSTDGSSNRNASTSSGNQSNGGSGGTGSNNDNRSLPGATGFGTAGGRGGINTAQHQNSSSQGGAVNGQGSTPPPQQTGTGVSSDSGNVAGSGAVYTVIGAESNADGSVTYTFTRSGGGDGRDGIYHTTYSQNSNGSWSWETSNAVTGEVVGQGQGNPPSTGIVGTSTQDVEDDTAIFADEDDDETEGRVNPSAGGRGQGSLNPSTIDSPKDPSPIAGGRGPGSLFPSTIGSPKDPNPAAEGKGPGATVPRFVRNPVDTLPDLAITHGPVTSTDLPPGGTRMRSGNTSNRNGSGQSNSGIVSNGARNGFNSLVGQSRQNVGQLPATSGGQSPRSNLTESTNTNRQVDGNQKTGAVGSIRNQAGSEATSQSSPDANAQSTDGKKNGANGKMKSKQSVPTQRRKASRSR